MQTAIKHLGFAYGARSHGLIDLIGQMISVQHQRRQLAQLDARALEDLGLTHADVAREAGRSAWDVPATWRK